MADETMLDDSVTTTTTDWKAQLPDDLRDHPSLKNMKDIGSVVKSYVNAEKMIGSRIPVPEKEDDKAWETVFTKLGRPESADKYDFSNVDGFDLVKDDPTLAAFLPEAHKIGLSQRQAAQTVKFYAEQAKAAAEAQRVALAQAESDLRKEFGAAFNDRLKMAKDVVSKFGGDELLSALGPAANSPTVVKALSEIGKLFASDRVYGAGGEPKNLNSYTPEEAAQRVEELISKNVNILRDPMNPEGRRIQQEINRLMELSVQ